MRNRDRRSSWLAAYQASHREERRAYQAAYQASHRAEYAAARAAHPEKQRAYEAAHREEIAACARAYRAAHREERAAYAAAYRATHKADIRANNRLRRYGISSEGYERLFDAQGGVCAICGKPEPRRNSLAVDHDHGCCPGSRSCGGCIRGLLCSPCNTGLGMFGDDPLRMMAAASYVGAS